MQVEVFFLFCSCWCGCAKTLDKQIYDAQNPFFLLVFLLLPVSRRDPFILRLRVAASVAVRTIDGVDVATKSNRDERDDDDDDDDTDDDARTRMIRGWAKRLMRRLFGLALLLLINGSLILLVRCVPPDESIDRVN